MLNFASEDLVTIDIKPLQISYLSLTVFVGGKLLKLGQNPSKCKQNVKNGGLSETTPPPFEYSWGWNWLTVRRTIIFQYASY
jgi:hypothetical protein